MKAVILAGGLGTRLQEATAEKPKPMVEIGGLPILWHIMKIYAAHGFKEFVLALGYKSEVVKDFFLNYHHRRSSLSVHLQTGHVETHDLAREDWLVHLVDTGPRTQTGGRIKRLTRWLESETFMMTYGDGVANIDLRRVVEFHRRHGKLATVTAVRPQARFGGLNFAGDLVTIFSEKPQIGEGWVNGGFFVLEPAFSTTSPATRRRGSTSRSSGSRRTASSSPIVTTASGNAWTRCATFASWRVSGRRAGRPGTSGTAASEAGGSDVAHHVGHPGRCPAGGDRPRGRAPAARGDDAPPHGGPEVSSVDSSWTSWPLGIVKPENARVASWRSRTSARAYPSAYAIWWTTPTSSSSLTT
jgi:glucose-1-phosphate cytidylyltransferase